MFPGVTAASFATWDSSSCGLCAKVVYPATGSYVYATVIDQCGSISGYDTHFDLDPTTFSSLMGGLTLGHAVAVWEFVGYENCFGNKG